MKRRLIHGGEKQARIDVSVLDACLEHFPDFDALGEFRPDMEALLVQHWKSLRVSLNGLYPEQKAEYGKADFIKAALLKRLGPAAKADLQAFEAEREKHKGSLSGLQQFLGTLSLEPLKGHTHSFSSYMDDTRENNLFRELFDDMKQPDAARKAKTTPGRGGVIVPARSDVEDEMHEAESLHAEEDMRQALNAMRRSQGRSLEPQDGPQEVKDGTKETLLEAIAFLDKKSFAIRERTSLIARLTACKLAYNHVAAWVEKSGLKPDKVAKEFDAALNEGINEAIARIVLNRPLQPAKIR